MPAPLPSEAKRITPGFQEPAQGTQGPRPELLGWLDQYGPHIASVSVKPAQGDKPAQIVISLGEVPGHEGDTLAAGMRRFQGPLDQVAPI